MAISLEHCKEAEILRTFMEPYRNIRETLRDIEELAANIAQHGVLVPPLVTPRPDKPNYFWILDGNRRWAATGPQFANITKLKVRVCPTIPDDVDLGILQASLALHSDGLTAWEISKKFSETLCARPDWKQADIAKSFGKPAYFVSEHLAFLKGTPAVQDAYRMGAISAKICAGICQFPLSEQDDALNSRKNGATLEEISTVRKRKVVASAAQRASAGRVIIALPDGKTVTVAGGKLSLQDVADALKRAWDAAKDGIKAHLELRTWAQAMKDKAAAVEKATASSLQESASS